MIRVNAMKVLAVCGLILGAVPGISQQSPTESPNDGPLVEATVPQKSMTNDSVVRMVKAGLGDELVVQTINTQPGRFSTGADDLVALKAAGVSDRVITAMVNSRRKLLTPGPETAAVQPPVDEIGAYYKDGHGNWVPIESEFVHIKSGGFIKSTVTDGIIKQDRNGHLNGRESKLALQRPIQILLYVPEEVSPKEYELLRFRLNSNSREFRTLTGGVFHSTGGADRDEVPFTTVKKAPRTYEFTIDDKVGGGEYGILPPGTGNVTNGGKIYTFAITE